MTTPSPDAGRQENRTLDQITLISRVLEGDVPAPKVIVHDYTINGEPGISETATLSYSIPLPRDAVTFAQTEAAKAMPLYDGTVWKITLQTYKVARLAETMRISWDDEHATGLARLQARIDQLSEDLGIRTRDFQDALTVSAQIEAERDEARAQLAAARARIAELESERPDGTTRQAPA